MPACSHACLCVSYTRECEWARISVRTVAQEGWLVLNGDALLALRRRGCRGRSWFSVTQSHWSLLSVWGMYGSEERHAIPLSDKEPWLLLWAARLTAAITLSLLKVSFKLRSWADHNMPSHNNNTINVCRSLFYCVTCSMIESGWKGEITGMTLATNYFWCSVQNIFLPYRLILLACTHLRAKLK